MSPSRALISALAIGESHDTTPCAGSTSSSPRMVTVRSPDLIIADIQLPYMSGDEFVAALRADPAVRDIPVIFLSVDAKLEAHAKRLGAVAYFDKSVSAERLVEVVDFYTAG